MASQPISIGSDYSVSAESAQFASIRQGTHVLAKLPEDKAPDFVVPASVTEKLKPGIATFVCRAKGMTTWSFNVPVVAKSA